MLNSQTDAPLGAGSRLADCAANQSYRNAPAGREALELALAAARAGHPVMPYTTYDRTRKLRLNILGRWTAEEVTRARLRNAIPMHGASVDEAKIERWWRKYPEADVTVLVGFDRFAILRSQADIARLPPWRD